MPFFKLEPVTPALKFCAFFRRYGRLVAIIIYIVNELLAVIVMAGQYIAARNVKVFKHGNGIFDIAALPFAYDNADRIAISVNCRMDFGAVSATAVPDFI